MNGHNTTPTETAGKLEAHARFLAGAFSRILGDPAEGSMAFVRCLPRDVVIALCDNKTFTIQGWELYGVTESRDETARLIPADWAVELREDKRGRVLLLVDVSSAGAGMDGIYSASREVTEGQLFEEASKLARIEIRRGWKGWAHNAVKRARKLGERNTISPWREFDFYTEAATTGDTGRAIARLGLWPVKADASAEDGDLEIAARIVEKLLLGTGGSRSPAARVESLMLVGADEDTKTELEKFVRLALGQPLDVALKSLEQQPGLWLHSIEPGFASQGLQRIDITTWRGKAGRVAAWSGLIDRQEDLPLLLVNPDATSAKEATRLEVRWTTHPDVLAKSSVEYRVTVFSGEEELAATTVTHSDRSPQKARFTAEDFADLDENSKFEARIRVAAVGSGDVEPKETDEFVLQFGQPPDKPNAGSGSKVRALVEGAIHLPDQAAFTELCEQRGVAASCGEDRLGWVQFRPVRGGRSFRVFRPPLVQLIEADWLTRPDAVGRWKIRVRGDGSRVGEPEFVQFDQGATSAEAWNRLVRASRRLCEETAVGPGIVARIAWSSRGDIGDDYVNAWASVIEQGPPQLALGHTVEVTTLSGRTIGLIVLPSHPIRIAWQTAYDHLAQYMRYELKLSPEEVLRNLRLLDSSQFPALLPGLSSGSSFVFGDVLGFHSIAMVLDLDLEPKAAVALIAQAYADGVPEASPSIARHTAEVLAGEIGKYAQSHRIHRSLHIHALRPGDGATVARAMGQFVATPSNAANRNEDSDDADDMRLRDLSFVLEMFPARNDAGVTGRFLAQAAERRRAGSGLIDAQDRWMLESLCCPGGINLPRLRWAKREVPLPERSAHLAIAFDIFESKIECLSPTQVEQLPTRPLHAYGLIASPERRWSFEPVPTWESIIPPQVDGEKHPAGRPLTDRLLRILRATLRTVARNLGAADGSWPALRTTLLSENQEALARLHRLCDWVVTVDRNAGIEFFDSPRNARAVYETYIIDVVPERDDLGCMQMVTSTSQTDEIRDLLDAALGEMGLSSSLRNCQFLLEHLKAISGRLAIRLTGPAQRSGELIALALVHANCMNASSSADDWLPLQNGFLMPLDDLRDLHPPFMGRSDGSEDDDERDGRADLVFVTASARGSLQLSFVEVKFRRHLRTARDPALVTEVVRQAEGTWASWTQWYLDEVPDVPRAIRRSRLARAMRFYADKAARHHLSEAMHTRMIREIDKMLVAGREYQFTFGSRANRGYIFCPEVTVSVPVELPSDLDGDTRVFLFGPGQLPELAAEPVRPAPPPSTTSGSDTSQNSFRQTPGGDDSELAGRVSSDASSAEGSNPKSESIISGSVSSEVAKSETEPPLRSATSMQSTPEIPVIIQLGRAAPGGHPIEWEVSIESNPHLMIVGLPGMGKTTCLISLCRQLIEADITPIVFSYHQDLDEKVAQFVPTVRLLDHSSLGFNPLNVNASAGANAHVDSAGMLRDIFSAIFTDFGDIQTERIRQAIKRSYTELGWGQATAGADGTLKIPGFRRFFELLRDEAKPDRGLMARLTELDDYGVFSGQGDGHRLLESAEPTILQIHKNQNEVVQRAFASLIFYSIYKDMFRRGVQKRLTHAVIFDEAHRASRLKLLPTMAKECRKYGMSLILASQEAKDFDVSLYSAIANYLVLRVTEHDAKALSRNIAASDIQRQTSDRLKLMEKYHGLFFGEGTSKTYYGFVGPMIDPERVP